MEYLFGFGIAALVAVFASVVGFDRERGFYPVILIVIASYYILFAAIGTSPRTLAFEAIPMSVFVLAAVAGFRRTAWILVGGLAAHGVFDFAHGWLITNPGMPEWWPGFCLAYDLTAAFCMAILLRSRNPKKEV